MAQRRRKKKQIDMLNRMRTMEEEEEEEEKEGGREDNQPFPDIFLCTCSDPHRIIFKGLYVFSYEYYTKFFPTKNLHVVTAEELRVRGGEREGGRKGKEGGWAIETTVCILKIDLSPLISSLHF